MQIQDVLYRQGFGTRRECAALIHAGMIEVQGRICSDPMREFTVAGLRFVVQGEEWSYREKAYLMLHKPAGTECSHRPAAWPSVYSLLPMPLRRRPQKGGLAGVQAVGRLDQDTTGLLLLTDDGPLIQRLNSPRHHVPKVYEIGTTEPLDHAQVRRLLDGVVLHDDPLPVRAADCEIIGDRALRLTLTQGKYHQVKRMVVAAGNHVAALHRVCVGALCLPADLAPGQFRWLDASQIDALRR